MIDQLCEYGKRKQKEDEDAGNICHDSLKLEPVSVDLVIKEDGIFDGFTVIEDKIERLAEALTGKKGQARLLLDKAEEVLNYISPREIKNAKGNIEKAQKTVNAKHQLFIKKLEEYKSLDILKPVFLFYSLNKEKGIDKALSEFEIQVTGKKKDGNISFRIGNKRLLEEQSVHDSLIANYEAKSKAENKGEKCSICGTSNFPIARLHEKIKGLLPFDSKSSNRVLVTFDKESFWSFGFKQSKNSRICTNCAKNYAKGLNSLIANKNNKKYFGADTTMVFWTREPIEFDELNMLDTPDPSKIANLFDSVFKGREWDSKNIDINKFYSITLTGAATRIAVRDWVEISVEEYRKNIANWFRKISITDDNQIKYPGLSSLAYSTIKTKPDKISKSEKEIISRIANHLWIAALKGIAPPMWILSAVLARIRYVESKEGEKTKKDPLTHVRAALIKLILNFNNIKKGGNMINEKLDPDDKTPAILCGQIFAVMENIQQAALGKDINAGIRDRYFSYASTNPAAAFGVLLDLSIKHLNKLSHEEPKLSKYLENKLGNFTKGFVESKGFPKFFTLEEQGQFALGYYYQKQIDRPKKKEQTNEQINIKKED